MSNFTNTLVGLTLDAYVSVTTRAGRTFTGSVAESGPDEIALLVRRSGAAPHLHTLDFVRVLLSEISSFEEHADGRGDRLGCFFDFVSAGGKPTVKMTLASAMDVSV